MEFFFNKTKKEIKQFFEREYKSTTKDLYEIAESDSMTRDEKIKSMHSRIDDSPFSRKFFTTVFNSEHDLEFLIGYFDEEYKSALKLKDIHELTAEALKS